MKKIYKKHNSFISLKGNILKTIIDFLKKFNIVLKNLNLKNLIWMKKK